MQKQLAEVADELRLTRIALDTHIKLVDKELEDMDRRIKNVEKEILRAERV